MSHSNATVSYPDVQDPEVIGSTLHHAEGGRLLHPTAERMLRLLDSCGPQPALALGGAQPLSTRRGGLHRSVVDMTAREAGVYPASEARRQMDWLADQGYVRVSAKVLECARYLVLEDEHSGQAALRCSIEITRGGRTALAGA